jgi:hypothetical protein
MKKKLTPRSKDALTHVAREHFAGRWARSRNAGDRVSLAHLFYNGWIIRQAWRGEGTASPAYEYRLTEAMETAIRKRVAA